MSNKGNGGKKHRRGKKTVSDVKPELPDEGQYFAYVTKILGSGRVSLDYYKPIYIKTEEKDENKDDLSKCEIEWKKISSMGVIRGKMMRRVYVNLNDLVLVSEREFDDKKVDIIEKYNTDQIPYLKKNSEMTTINELNGGDGIEFGEEIDNEIDDI